MEKKFDRLDAKVTSLDTKVTSLDTKVTSLDKKVTSLDKKVTDLDAKVTGLDGKTNRIVAVMVRIEHDLNNTFSTKTDLRGMKNEIMNHIDGLTTTIKDYDNNMDFNKKVREKFDKRLGVLEKIHNIVPAKV